METTHELVDISAELQNILLRLTAEFLDEDGKSVDYLGLRNSSLFHDYEKLSFALHHVDLNTLRPQARKAFVINLYNALTIHGLASLAALPSSVLATRHFWTSTAYVVGDQVFSLDDLEHGILRANHPHPTSVKDPFGDDDPRRECALPDLDPRVHFALNCGAKSCPAIRVYTLLNMESALDAAAATFCQSGGVKANLQHRTLTMSRLFQWYRKDFGRSETEILRWLCKFLQPETRFAVEQLLQELEDIGGVTIAYSDYDWRLNATHPLDAVH